MHASVSAAFVAFLLVLTGGCPDSGTAVDLAGTDTDTINGTSSTGGGNPGSGDDPAPVDGPTTGIFISTPFGADTGIYDLYDATGTQKLGAALGTGEVEEVPAGTYVLKRYFSDVFLYATGVTVVPGVITEISFGAVNIVTVPGSAEATYDIWDAANTTLLEQADSDNTIHTLPPGTYVIRRYFREFVWASNVQIVAGQVTTIPLGALQLKASADWENSAYDIFAADGVTLLLRPEGANEVVPLPAGSYVLFDYFNEGFRYGSIDVQAGKVTTFEMGAIQYNGSESNYDIYDGSGTMLLERPASRGDQRAVPPGTYVLKDYFSDDVLAAGVVVMAGAVTTVP